LIFSQDAKILYDLESVVDVSNNMESKSSTHRFTVDILNAKDRKLIEAKKKHESNILEREREVEIKLAIEASEKKRADSLDKKKQEEVQAKKREELKKVIFQLHYLNFFLGRGSKKNKTGTK
jgi:hypothetical protein